MAKPKFLSLDGVQTLVQYFKDRLSEKVDIEPGKTLSDNNFSDEEKTKLAGIEADSQVNLIESISVNGNNQSITNKNVDIAVPLVDNTLTQAGQSADAKATGDAISELTQSTANDVANLQQSISSTATTIRGEIADEVTTINQTISDVENAIPTNVSELTNDSNYATTSQLTTQITNVRNDIPTNVSELVNDSDYTTKLYVDGEIANVEGDIPINISQLNNDSNYTTKSYVDGEIDAVEAAIPTNVSQLTNDVKYQTENEVARSIANSVSQITSFDYQILNELPQTGKKGTIYLVLHAHGNDDKFDEYIWVNNRYEKLGNTDIDLSGYARTTDLPTKVSDLNNDSNFTTKTYVDGKLDTKQDVIDYGTPTENDVGKALISKTISNGKVTEWEFGDTGMAALDDKAPIIINTASGTIVSFADGVDDMPIKKCVVDIEPVQDLHGYDRPWPAGGGKNLFNESNAIVEYDSNRYCKLENGLLHYKNGGDLYCYSKDFDINLPSGSYTLSLSNYRLVSGVAPIWMIRIGSNPLTYPSTNTAYTFTLAEPNTVKIRLSTAWTTSATEFYGNVQLEKGSTVTSYEPYSNICPITGQTGAKVTRTGKNMLHIGATSGTYGGLSITANVDGSITANGTESVANVSFTLYTGSIAPHTIKKGVSYVLSGVSGHTTNTCYLQLIYKGVETGNTISIVSSNNFVNYTPMEDARLTGIYLSFRKEATFDNYTVYPQFELGSTATDYEPYTGQLISVNWETEAGTVYGGTIDVTTGLLTVNRVSATFTDFRLDSGYPAGGSYLFSAAVSDSIRLPSNQTAMSDKLVFDTTILNQDKTGFYIGYGRLWARIAGISMLTDFKSLIPELTAVYQLATPITYHLTPTEIRTLLGTNNIWADTGDTEVAYCADTKEYVDGHGKVTDVQVNGTSIVSDGVAEIPVADASTAGVIKADPQYGVGVKMSGKAGIIRATSSEVKSGTNIYKPITPITQHESTFYGLAKAAGDTTQSASSNAVGTYTTEAKSAICSMLGVDSVQTVTVSGTDVTINGVANTAYQCGEVTSITITPPNTGIIDVTFTSGSTVAVLSLPNTVKMPEWFDITNLESNTIYEINISNGIYGTVMSWAI